MKWKSDLKEVKNKASLTDEFLRLYQHGILIALKEAKFLSPMQYRRAEELLGRHI